MVCIMQISTVMLTATSNYAPKKLLVGYFASFVDPLLFENQADASGTVGKPLPL